MLSNVKSMPVSDFFSKGIVFVKDTTVYEILRRLYHLLRILEPPMRRKVFYMQASSFASGFLNTLIAGQLALLLIVIASPEIIDDNKYFAWSYDFLGADSKEEFIVWLVGGFAFFFVFTQLVILGILLVNRYVSLAISHTCSIRLFNYYLSRSYEENVNSDVNEMFHHQNVYDGTINQVISNSVTLIATLLNAIVVIGAILVLHFNASLIIVVSILLFHTTVYFVFKRRRKFYGKRNYLIGLQKMRILRQGAFGYIEVVMRGKVKEHIDFMKNLYAEQLLLSVKTVLMNNLPQKLLFATGMVVVFLVIYYIVETSSRPTQMFSLTAILAGAALRLFPMIGGLYGVLNASLSDQFQYESVIRVLEESYEYPLPTDDSEDSPDEYLKVEREVSLHKVWYSYQKDGHYEIQDMSFSISKGEMVALCGLSGSGKTTIAKLVSGLIVPVRGDVLADGKSIHKDLDCKSWRKSVGYVTQNPFFMDETIALNVAFEVDESKIDYAKVKDAVTKAGLEDVISDLEDGLKTPISSASTVLSGGQLQRIAIARAVYRDSALLIFDESTSALDRVTEKKVLDSILLMKNEIPVLVISHGLESLRRADRILVIDHGALVAEGSYEELRQGSDLFNSLISGYSDAAKKDSVEE